MDWISSFESYMDFISYVLLSAPNDFPREDFLSEEDQMDLESAFAELRNGIHFLDRRISADLGRTELISLLDASLQEYRRGSESSGAILLQDFEQKILDNDR